MLGAAMVARNALAKGLKVMRTPRSGLPPAPDR